ncbi:type II toxin-antitoxin system HicB family antitoxin [Bacillus cereus]|uniref:type II toxin-antitoxin system HicB family antitoxin n=1 Tax=Bacillus cereus TaxID=1396 RepID=UPI00159BB209|nr:type II toxin-antitoxin system HicB family antitoxin [Bacillus cereus]
MNLEHGLNKEEKRLVNLPHLITLQFLKDESDEYYVVEIPSLKGCKTTGETIKKALHNIIEVKIMWVQTALEFGDDIPIPDNIKPVIEILKPYTSEEIKEMHKRCEKMVELIQELKQFENVLFFNKDL